MAVHESRPEPAAIEDGTHTLIPLVQALRLSRQPKSHLSGRFIDLHLVVFPIVLLPKTWVTTGDARCGIILLSVATESFSALVEQHLLARVAASRQVLVHLGIYGLYALTYARQGFYLQRERRLYAMPARLPMRTTILGLPSMLLHRSDRKCMPRNSP